MTFGPLVDTTLTPPLAILSQLQSIGHALPSVRARLMIDTGAQKTVIDRQIAEQLGLSPIRFESMVGVSHVPEDCPVYLMSMTIFVGDGTVNTPLTFTTEMIGMKTPPIPRHFAGLLGRDFFRFVTIVYDGPAGCVDIIAPAQESHSNGGAGDEKA